MRVLLYSKLARRLVECCTVSNFSRKCFMLVLTHLKKTSEICYMSFIGQSSERIDIGQWRHAEFCFGGPLSENILIYFRTKFAENSL